MNFDSLNIGSNNSFDPSRSLCIEASAGTGKTYTIQQIVARLINDGTPLNKILIVTYTEKAAGELKDRIRKKIEEALDTLKLNKDNKEDVEYNKVKDVRLFAEALREVDNAPIFTIHSFCQKTLRENAYDAGRPFDMTMIDEEFVEGIIAEWSRSKWLDNKLYQILLSSGIKAQSLIKGLSGLLCNSINIYKGTDNSGSEIVKLSEPKGLKFGSINTSCDEVCAMLERGGFAGLLQIRVVGEAYLTLKKYKASTFDAVQHQNGKNGPKDVAKNGKSVADFINTLESWDGTGNKKIFGTAQFGNELKSAQPAELFDALNLFYEGLNDSAGIYAKIGSVIKNIFLVEQTPELFRKWQTYKDSHKCQSYNDMILSVHHAVLAKDSYGNESLLCQKLRKQYKYAIIDEFQDTNQLQWDIFKKLFSPIFVVGDSKQSIYSFQGADVNVYQKAIEHIKTVGVKNDLVNNFRSTKNIIEGCNHLFEAVNGKDFFAKSQSGKSSDSDNTNFISFTESHFPKDAIKVEPTFKGSPQNPFIIPEKEIGETAFAQAAVEKIIEFCTFTNVNSRVQTALQVFDKDHPDKLRDVTFKDFAVLARTRSEMEIIEDAMRNAGVPFARYKDTNLFNGRECAEWIALFKAIDASDFTARNRRLLSEVLITDFFRVKLSDAEKDLFDDPMNIVRQRLQEWKAMAEKRRFAELQEKVYEHTQIEKHLMDLSMLQNLAKLRQIGNYCIAFLYQNNASISDIVRHLEGLRKDDADTDDEDGNLVAKGTDFDAVQVMTIHASKGLEFPVVISVAGFKQFNDNVSGPFIYHEGESTKMGFENDDKAIRKSEEIEEWKRLFYVDFTRASSVLIMPRYTKWRVKDSEAYKPEFEFLGRAFDNLWKNHQKYIEKLPECNWGTERPDILRNIVKTQILKPLSDASRKEQDEGSREQQELCANNLQKDMAKLGILQFSYSTLNGKADESISETGADRSNKDEGNDAQDAAREAQLIKYPKGNKLGNALHSIFEDLKFQEFGQIVKSLESAKIHAQLVNLIDDQFKKQGLPIWKHQKEWTDHTAEIVWNTLHAELPEISGGTFTGERFSLTSIPSNKIKKECQFNVNATLENCGIASGHLGRMFKGFMDVIFVRSQNKNCIFDINNVRYSILDWKSDILENDIYSDAAVRAKVDEEYSIQRVLYSYCLIKWLNQFYPEKTDAEIFDQHFGGIYYVFLRGTQEGQSSGIYAHTWKSFDDLQKSFDKLKVLMKKKRAQVQEGGEDDE
ncbi:MAG: UvrD-helicase domain-containing protein [Fibrobacter sp.]|nr:UvrD-helicase domain-containing protein [Fibrobacter sp.]